MPIERFYSTTDTLEGPEHHHATRVLRLAPGDSIEVTDGKGTLLTAQITTLSQHNTHFQVLHTSHHPPSPHPFLAALPLLRPSKLEWIIEKGTELGADAFLLYLADHSEKTTLSAHQLERLRAITISALKQSGRLYLPSLELLPHLSSLLEKTIPLFFGDPTATTFFHPELKSTLFITGPEKGFSADEMTLLREKGRGVRLNQNVLRAETAPIAALALWGATAF